VNAPIPGSFQLEHVLHDDYAVRIGHLPEGAYVADITYAGLSILNKPLRTGSAMGQAGLRIVLGRDGGRIAVEVADKDGDPVSQATVVIALKEARSEAEFAAALVSGQTDQTGKYLSGAIAPGEYLVMAINSRLDYSPETIGRLWRARASADEIDLAPGQTALVRLEGGTR
jgi:hypothetical protein